MLAPPNLAAYRLRANPDYRIVTLAELDAKTRASLAPLLGDGVVGLFQPRQPGRGTAKALDEPGLRLLTALAAPGPLPDDLRPTDRQGEEALVALILDGILELAEGDRFASGVEAYAALYGAVPELAPAGPLADRSLAALRLAADSPLLDPLALSSWLYAYGRRPLTAAWRRRLHSVAATEDFLGLTGDEARALLDRHWRRGDEHPAWLTWSPRRQRARATRYKLYLSPRTEELPELLRAMLGVFAHHDPPPFKAGRDAANLLRPDKLVAYFASRDELDAAVRALRPALAGLTADGVPFTAAASADGLLSWGIDPPAEPGVDLASRESWRLWLTNRLALALVAARDTTTGLAPWQFALARLSLAGIDPRSWVPGEVNWAA